jgi:hypothetical protein
VFEIIITNTVVSDGIRSVLYVIFSEALHYTVLCTPPPPVGFSL